MFVHISYLSNHREILLHKYWTIMELQEKNKKKDNYILIISVPTLVLCAVDAPSENRGSAEQ